MNTIAVINLKGGTGKTSTCFHLGGMLAKRGRRVLLVDNDPQASLSQGFWGASSVFSLDPNVTVYAAYAGDPLPETLIHGTPFDNLRLMPGHEAVERLNTPSSETWGERPFALSSILSEVAGDYDMCLIDNDPKLNMCSFAALLAADRVIVPLQAEDYGAQGGRRVNRAIAAARSVRGGSPTMLGYLITMYDKRQSVHQGFEGSIRGRYNDLVFATRIPAATDFKQAVAVRTPISAYKSAGLAWSAMAALADEIEMRLATPGDGEGVAA